MARFLVWVCAYYKKWLIPINFRSNFSDCCHDIKLVSGFYATQVNHGFFIACHLNCNSSILKALVWAPVNSGVLNLYKMWIYCEPQTDPKNSEERIPTPMYIIKLNEAGNKGFLLKHAYVNRGHSPRRIFYTPVSFICTPTIGGWWIQRLLIIQG